MNRTPKNSAYSYASRYPIWVKLCRIRWDWMVCMKFASDNEEKWRAEYRRQNSEYVIDYYFRFYLRLSALIRGWAIPQNSNLRIRRGIFLRLCRMPLRPRFRRWNIQCIFVYHRYLFVPAISFCIYSRRPLCILRIHPLLCWWFCWSCSVSVLPAAGWLFDCPGRYD